MKDIMTILKSIFAKGQHNLMKIFSLAIGLALGTVLISKVSFEESYNNFCNDSQRIYLVSEIFENNDGENEEYPQTAGGIAVYMRQFIPDIETSTRFTWLGGGNTFTISDSREKINATYAVADTCLFDILTRRIIQGNPKEVLCTELQAMVSESLAKKIGPDAVGKTIFLDGKEETKISIGGIFEDLPENSDFQMDMFLSMPSIRHFTWDGSMNLLGNDRYTSLVKLRPGADISVVQEYTARFITEYAPEYANLIRLNLIPLSDYHDFVSSARNMKVLLALIAFALLFTAVMNYVLLSLSSIIHRAKQIAVRKCYGASSWDIYRNILLEACVHTLIALILAFILLFAFRDIVEKIAGTPVTTLLGSSIHWILLTVVVIILLGGLLPGMVFARIPLASAFRNYRESKRTWKLAFMGIQFIAASFLLCLMFVASGQYSKMTTLDMGYDYTNLAYMNIESSNSNPTQAQLLMDEISKLPEVESVTFATSIPMFGSSGDNVYLPGTSEELFHCVNLYYSGTNYFDVMNIPIVSGSGFTSTTPGEQVMVSRSFAEMIKSTAGWDDNIVGRQVCITSYKNPMTIVGVYEDFMIGTVGEEDEDPSAMVTAWYPVSNLLIKYHSLDAAAMSATEALATRLVPDKEYHVYSYEDDLIACYQDTRSFRDSLLIGGVMTLLIVLCGLIGFTGDEVNFRKKEIAIRKVLGADSQNTVGLILGNVTKIAVPAVIVGALVAVLISRNWLQQFSEKISLGWYIFLTGAVVVLLVCELIAAYNVIRATMENPAESLKSE